MRVILISKRNVLLFMSSQVSSLNDSSEQSVKRRLFSVNIGKILPVIRKYAVLSLTPGKVKIYAVVLVFSFIAFIYIKYFFELVFSEQRHINHNSIAFSLLINELIKDLPAFKPLEDSQKKYFYQLVTDESEPVNIVTYHSPAEADEIISYYRLYFEILNYSFVNHEFDSQALAFFKNTREGFNVFVEDNGESRKVTIEYYEL